MRPFRAGPQTRRNRFEPLSARRPPILLSTGGRCYEMTPNGSLLNGGRAVVGCGIADGGGGIFGELHQTGVGHSLGG